MMDPIRYLPHLLKNMNELLFLCDSDLKVLSVNDKTSMSLGMNQEDLVGRSFFSFIPEDFKTPLQSLLWNGFSETKPWQCDFPIVKKDQTLLMLHLHASPLMEDNKLQGVLILATEKAVSEPDQIVNTTLEKRLRLSIENMPDSFGLYQAIRNEYGYVVDFRVEYVNTAARTSHLTNKNQQTGHKLSELLKKNQKTPLFDEYRNVMDTGKPLITEWLEHDEKNNLTNAYHIRAIRLEEFLAVWWRDITDCKKTEEELRTLILVDELTGLYNRRGFITLAQQQLKIASRMKREMLLLFVDVDGLKLINDTMGHHEGDRALVDTARILKQSFREPDIIARISGDEFAVLIIEALGAQADAIMHRFKTNLGVFVSRRGRPYQLSLSMGIARYTPEEPCFVNDLLERADGLMYEDKRRKRLR